MPNSDRSHEGEVPNGPRAPTSSPAMPRCPRCGHPDFEIVRDEWGRHILVCEYCGYRIAGTDPRFATPPR
ncbi:MAG: hypothetical protein NT169_14395 [Chloroflexi bacterium]|nr:hypothetical protein [Chloroflexota bacterium]